jgi:hypothetical protein
MLFSSYNTNLISLFVKTQQWNNMNELKTKAPGL